MDEFFCDFIYSQCGSFCGEGLDKYLAGFVPETSEYYSFGYVGYPTLGMIAFLAAIIGAVTYYYSPFTNKSTFNRWFHWALWGGIFSVIVLIISTVLCNNAINLGDVDEHIPEDISLPEFTNCLMIGLYNLFITFISFFISSMAIKWGSSNNRRTPF